MRQINPKDVPFQEVHRYLLGGVAPRPIALVSTISEKGVINLSPFSFFNAFGANPPVVAFSPARRGRDGTLKDTYNYLMKTRECVINAVTYDMVEQVSLASTEYETGVNEFVKSGLTPLDSVMVKAKRVKESPFQMECKLLQMVNLGEGPAAGNLAVCEVVYFHIAEDIIRDGNIEPELIDLVARNSANYYTRASGAAIFEVEKPIGRKGVGYDNLPQFIKESRIYSANNLGQFANSEVIPEKDEVLRFINALVINEASEEEFYRYERLGHYQKMLEAAVYLEKNGSNKAFTLFEKTAKCALESKNVDFAWKVAVYAGIMPK